MVSSALGHSLRAVKLLSGDQFAAMSLKYVTLGGPVAECDV